jgi:hypothetical protein
MSAMTKIAQIVLVTVCLTLEAYVVVRFQAVMIFKEQAKPLNDVPQVKADEQEFALLCRMYALMVKLHRRQSLHRKDDSK